MDLLTNLKELVAILEEPIKEESETLKAWRRDCKIAYVEGQIKDLYLELMYPLPHKGEKK